MLIDGREDVNDKVSEECSGIYMWDASPHTTFDRWNFTSREVCRACATLLYFPKHLLKGWKSQTHGASTVAVASALRGCGQRVYNNVWYSWVAGSSHSKLLLNLRLSEQSNQAEFLGIRFPASNNRLFFFYIIKFNQKLRKKIAKHIKK